jgi:hypothetical protein
MSTLALSEDDYIKRLRQLGVVDRRNEQEARDEFRELKVKYERNYVHFKTQVGKLGDVAFAALHELVHDELEERMQTLTNDPIVKLDIVDRLLRVMASRGHPEDSRN